MPTFANRSWLSVTNSTPPSSHKRRLTDAIGGIVAWRTPGLWHLVGWWAATPQMDPH